MVTNTHVESVQSTCMGCVDVVFICDGILLQMNIRSGAINIRKDGNRQRQAQAHNNIAAKGICHVVGVIGSLNEVLNPMPDWP